MVPLATPAALAISSTVASLNPFFAKTLRAASSIPAVRNSVTTSFLVLTEVDINLQKLTMQSVYYAKSTNQKPQGGHGLVTKLVTQFRCFHTKTSQPYEWVQKLEGIEKVSSCRDYCSLKNHSHIL